MNIYHPQYNRILDKIQSLHAELSALWMQPGGGKNVSPADAKEIATSVLPDLQDLVNETKKNIARHAESKT